MTEGMCIKNAALDSGLIETSASRRIPGVPFQLALYGSRFLALAFLSRFFVVLTAAQLS